MSSLNNKYISNQEAVPVIDSDVFADYPDRRFAIGVFSPEKVINCQPNSIEQAYLKLRANVYIDQTRMLDEDVRRIDGTELDDDDERSVHFAVLENRLGKTAVFACLRLIEKTNQNSAALPIEKFFPDTFLEPAPINSIEVSRFIVRHDNNRLARLALIKMIQTGFTYADENDFGPALATVGPAFERDLKLANIPTHRITEQRFIPKYKDDNLGLMINMDEFKQWATKMNMESGQITVDSFRYWGNLDAERLDRKKK
jgi:N-acyl-L-homoserine lactone synthetase